MNKKFLQFVILAFIAACCLYMFNVQLDFYIDDSALYGALSKHMIQTNDFLSLIIDQEDWLDKPHFPFWVAAISFKIFGVSSFSYNLPLIFAIGLSFFYTFKFACRHYNKTVAWLSIFILSTAQYTLISSTEGRVEPYLMLAVIGSIYHFDRVADKRRILDIVLGSALVAIAIMTKGTFIIIPIFGAIGGHLLYKKRSLLFMFKWYWLLAVALISVFILPEIIALYYQFDSQPGKIVFGQTGVSGIKWFLWESQYSRFINSGPITRPEGNLLYYLHTLLWAFFPWCILLYYGLFKIIRKRFNKNAHAELYTFSGSILILILFSISKFQLPHYLTIVFPLFSVIVANVICEPITKAGRKIIISAQAVQICMVMAVMAVIMSFLGWPLISYLLFFSVLAGVFLLIFRSSLKITRKIIVASGLMTLFFNIYMSLSVYPVLSQYKADIQAAKYINEHFEERSVIVLGDVSHRFEFYCKVPVTHYKNPGEKDIRDIKKPVLLLFTNVKIPDQTDPDYILVKTFDHYSRDAVSVSFLNPKTRSEKLSRFTLFSKNFPVE